MIQKLPCGGEWRLEMHLPSPGMTLPPRGQLITLREERKKDQVKH